MEQEKKIKIYEGILLEEKEKVKKRKGVMDKKYFARFILNDGVLQVILGINALAVHTHLEVAVIAGSGAGHAHPGDGLALIHLVPGVDQQGRAVGVVGDGAVVMGDDDGLAVAATPTGEGDGAAVSSGDLGAIGSGNIQTGVEGSAAEDITVTEPRGNGT